MLLDFMIICIPLTGASLAMPHVLHVTAQSSARVQVDCTPPGNLEIRVLEYRPSSGGYLKITPWQTAGLATVAKIEYKQSGAAVSEQFHPALHHILDVYLLLTWCAYSLGDWELSEACIDAWLQ